MNRFRRYARSVSVVTGVAAGLMVIAPPTFAGVSHKASVHSGEVAAAVKAAANLTARVAELRNDGVTVTLTTSGQALLATASAGQTITSWRSDVATAAQASTGGPVTSDILAVKTGPNQPSQAAAAADSVTSAYRPLAIQHSSRSCAWSVWWLALCPYYWSNYVVWETYGPGPGNKAQWEMDNGSMPSSAVKSCPGSGGCIFDATIVPNPLRAVDRVRGYSGVGPANVDYTTCFEE